ncbi:HET-domain-containing protein [Massarina eburnea CBS 473.64]|uniref:HET-domain-containing protein n=1 Tax=Massarina eburnea CBS 473.64 TaxID=1395130 RepID=A0A6A6SFC0_9PLEO|nr:HET-domain-containing protein [Massarina eburnea CBS 473.64]
MSLCDICKSIPWETLPIIPPFISRMVSENPYIQALYPWPQEKRGFPHCQSLSSLRKSASSCNLCSLILASAENVEKELIELKPKWDARKAVGYDWPTWEMWLVKREDGDGAWVMSFVDEEKAKMLGYGKKGLREAWIYVSLSYCWGRSRQFTTTRATIEERKRGIIIADIPTTYQDIIFLTRALNIRYLWIDSLCICQDEHLDWERESAKMLQTYSNAYLTVAASRAKDSAQGFLGPRQHTFVELEYTRGDIKGKASVSSLSLREESYKTDYIYLPEEPLSQRAWSLQERVLSHRVLIYATNQMFFECNEGFRSEDGLAFPRRHTCVHKSFGIEKLDKEAKPPVPGSKPTKTVMIQGWYDLLHQYGPRKLSHATDKLPALSGLASLYAERIGSDYLAGLWRDHLIEGLVWRSPSFRRVDTYRAPSWSWASGDGYPAIGLRYGYSELAEVVDASVTLKGENPFGEVSAGWIKLRAPMEQLFLPTEGWNPDVLGKYVLVSARTGNGVRDGMQLCFDLAFTGSDASEVVRGFVGGLEGVDVFALVLLKRALEPEDVEELDWPYCCLIVKRVQEMGVYERLGFAICGREELGWDDESEGTEGMCEVTLV